MPFVTVTIAVVVLAFGGGWVITIAIVGMVRFWHVLCWLCKSIYRLLTWPFRPRPHRAAPATGEARPLPRRDRSYVAVKGSLIVAVMLLVAASWFLSAGVNSATNPTQSTAAQIEPAPTTDTQSVTVYITRTGTKYHRNGCRYLRKSKIPITLDEAKRHYGPCSVCNPPR